jgi:hypothetical protein
MSRPSPPPSPRGVPCWRGGLAAPRSGSGCCGALVACSAADCRAEGPQHRRVDVLSCRKAWARLLAKVHELDIMACPRCGSRMSIIACLDRHGSGPPPQG